MCFRVCIRYTHVVQRRYHPERALSPMVNTLMEYLHVLGPQDYAMLLTSLANFGVHPGATTMGKLCASIEAQLNKFRPQELCSCYWALGLLQETSRPAFRAIGKALPAHYEKGRLADEGLLRQTFHVRWLLLGGF